MENFIAGKYIEKVFQEETKELNIQEGDRVVGLGLSGGGIRSAAFNLGLLQSLDVSNLMDKIQYLSTVSGGGYIGAAFSWFKAYDGGEGFPFARPDALPTDLKRCRTDWIRGRGDYLAPTAGLNIWAFIAAILRGTVVNLAILLPFILVIMSGLAMPADNFLVSFPTINTWAEKVGSIARFEECKSPSCNTLTICCDTSTAVTCKTPDCTSSAAAVEKKPDPKIVAADHLLLFGVIVGGGVLVIFGSLLYALFSYRDGWSARSRCRVQKGSGRFLWATLIFLVLGSLPLADRVIDHWIGISSTAGVFGLLAAMAGSLTRKKHNEGQGWRAVAIVGGLVVVSYLILVYFYHIAADWRQAGLLDKEIIIGCFLFSLVVGLLANINRVSMHRFYRERLREAFMPAYSTGELGFFKKGCTWAEPPKHPDLFSVSDLSGEKGTQKPYHIINTTLNTINSLDSKRAGRGGENFIFSPLYCGSQATGFRRTKEFADTKFSLATAFTISGAAVDPNNGATRFGPLTFLMTLFNIRLGYWCINPNLPQKPSRPWWIQYIWREMFQQGLNEEAEHIHLADGGHFENLGAYELIRRRCDVILVGDAGADPKNTFDSLGNLVERVRVDFGVEITIDTSPMEYENKQDKHKQDKNKQNKICEQPYLLGTIHYQKDGTKLEKKGILIYVNTCLFKGLPACVRTYQRMNETFPEQTTADQFFDEAQFEAYRELGFQAGLRMGLDLYKFSNADPKQEVENPWKICAKNNQLTPLVEWVRSISWQDREKEISNYLTVK